MSRSKISTGVWIGTGILILCVACVVSILIGMNLGKKKSNLPLFLQNLKEENAANKQPVFPPPPTSGTEFSANVLKNFPERVEGAPGTLEGKLGWMDGEFIQISNDEIDSNDRFDTSTTVGFTISDKNGDFFEHCYADKTKLGDLLLKLKDGNQIRVIGQAMSVLRPGTDATFDVWLRVDSIQVVK
jgi:hypothetical protein